jgi:hypothetical protein
MAKKKFQFQGARILWSEAYFMDVERQRMSGTQNLEFYEAILNAGG